MIYLISILFIAEVIILFEVVRFLIKIDKQVCLINAFINRRRILIRWRMETVKEITEGLNKIAPDIMERAKQKRTELLITQAKEIAEYVIILFFKPRYKKMLLSAKTGIRVAKKLLKI